MTPHQRSTGRVDDSLYPDDREEHSDSHQEQATLLNSRQEEPLLTEEEDEEHALEISSWKNLPWWKRPSPYWLIFVGTFRAMAQSAGVAPTVALYTDIVCRVHRPELVTNDWRALGYPPINTFTQISTIVPIPLGSDNVKTVGGGLFVHLPSQVYWTATSDYTQIGEKTCASDPVVQAVVAKLYAVLYTTVGILSCLTAGWWGSLSDRYGRRIIILTSTLGFLVHNVVLIITAWYVDVLPGRYWFSLVGFVIEGLCGGISTALAMKQACLADTTDPSTRSRYFSLSLGITYIGEAVGPALGGFLIRSTGSILFVFYFVSISYGFYIIAILLIPESLTRARARGARLRRRKAAANKVSGGRIPDAFETATGFLSPFLVLLSAEISGENSLGRRKKDWSLFCVAVAYGLSASLAGSASYKLLYAAAQFSWTSEMTSYFLSFLGVTRALFLAAALPLIIKYFQQRSSSLACGSSKQTLHTPTSPAVDLALARVSAVLGGAQYLGMAVASTGVLYTLANVLGSLSAGFVPAADSLALQVYSNKHSHGAGEAGKLFGAMSAISALSAGIISPALYGFVYSSMVAVFPQAVMMVSMCASCLMFFLLLFVRVPSGSIGDLGLPETGNEAGDPRDSGDEDGEIVERLR